MSVNSSQQIRVWNQQAASILTVLSTACHDMGTRLMLGEDCAAEKGLTIFSHAGFVRMSLFCVILEMSITRDPRCLMNSLQRIWTDQSLASCKLSQDLRDTNVLAGMWVPAVQSSAVHTRMDFPRVLFSTKPSSFCPSLHVSRAFVANDSWSLGIS